MLPRRRFVTVSLALLTGAACATDIAPGGTAADRDATRRGHGRGALASAAMVVPLDAAGPSAMFEQLVDHARRLARTAYETPRDHLPDALASLDYDRYRLIAFRPERALWHERGRFAIQPAHPGFHYRTPVRIHEIRDGQVVALPFDATMFDYRGTAAPLADVVGSDLEHAGLRVYYPLHDETGREEIAVFLGASYFRLVGPGQVYGLSSRGLAVNAGLSRGEEFPEFRQFWLRRPEPDADTLTFYALLDGPSVTGAYRFDLRASNRTELAVESALFARRDVGKLGVAPLSSMFLYGENRMPRFDDYRPQVHDSDGLLMETSVGEWIWRPLFNGPGLQVTSLRDDDPRGFGLVQRERRFDRYLDLEARYDRRPSEWVRFDAGDWGNGGVELLVIPAQSEFTDNIAAYWVPDEPFRVGDERRYRYRLFTFDDHLAEHTLAEVRRTRVGWDALPGQLSPPPRSQRQFVVDFGGGQLPSLDPVAPVEAVLEASAGQVSVARVQPLPERAGWRATFRLTPDGHRPADMRLYLQLGEQRLTETWSYVWYPERAE